MTRLEAALAVIEKLKCEPDIKRDNHEYPYPGCSICDIIAEFESQNGDP